VNNLQALLPRAFYFKLMNKILLLFTLFPDMSKYPKKKKKLEELMKNLPPLE
jgi:hypothetical protein